jgi:N-acetylmuramic acid 6-phosphate etherase
MVRILADASGRSLSQSEHALRQAGRNLRTGLVMLKLRVSAAEAEKTLRRNNGDLRAALGE